LLTLGAGLFAAGALIFTARNSRLARQTLDVTEQGQVTERYTRAIDQLGSDKLDVRIGGIFALERIALDSARDHPTIMEVLTAFVREHSREQRPLAEPVAGAPERTRMRPDVQEALTVIGRRDASRDSRQIGLVRSNLSGCYLKGADLAGATFFEADLTGAILAEANVSEAVFRNAKLLHAILILADLTRANLLQADLCGADLTSAKLVGAGLAGADLTGARLAGANFTGADLTRANLTRANLTAANLTRANLDGADLTDASLGANLSGANLSGAVWPLRASVPEGWQRDQDSARLSRAGDAATS
jgi:hypothetical protein